MPKPNYRVSATQLVALQYYLSDKKSEKEFIEQIQGEFKGNANTNAGSYVHEVIEKNKIHNINNIADGYFLDDPNFKLMELLKGIGTRFPFEQKITQEYDLGDFNLTLVTQFDQWAGYEINEHKTKYSAFDIDGYYESIQWRAYLLNTGANLVRYKVLECDLNDPKTEDEKPSKKRKDLRLRDDIALITVKDLHIFELPTYPNLKNEVLEYAQEFIHVATQLELLPHLSNQNKRRN